MQYLIKVTNFILFWCIVSTFVLGVFTIPVYAAGKKCHCGVEGCKVCGNCSGKTCSAISVRYRKKDGSTSSKHPYEKGVCCKKHPKLAKQGIINMTYRYSNGSWEHAYTVIFADDSSIGYNTDSKKYILYSNGGTSDESSLAGKYAKKHKLNLYAPDDKSTQLVKGDSKEEDSKKGGSSTDSSACESRFKDAYFDWEIPYSKKMSDLFDFSWINKNYSEKGLEKKESKTVASTIFFTASEGDSCLAPTKKLAKNINGVKYTGSFSKEKINGKECEIYTASDGSKYVVVNMPSDMLKWGESANDKSKAVRKHTNGLFMDFIAKDGTTVHGVQFSIAINTKELHYEQDGSKAADSCKTHHTSSAGVSNLVSEVKKQDWDVFHCWTMTSATHSTIKQGISLQGGSYSTADWFKAQGFTTDDKNPLVSVRFYTTRDTTDNPAKATSTDIVTKGTAPSTSSNGDSSGSKDTLQMNGFYSEAQLSSYTKLVEPELTDQVANSDKSVLTQEETEGLSDWQMNVERSKEHKGIATLINYVLTVIGVLLIIWGSIFYMAYWFDMINPFVDLDLVSRLSFGRFTASHELDGSCTWSLTKHKEGSGTHQQTINSKVALFISVCAIAIGVLIISGGLYRIVRSVFYGGAVLFHQMFG